jgi:hypothetical protein
MLEKLYGASAFISTREVAQRTGLGLRLVQYLCQHGYITPTRKVGGTWMIQEGYWMAVKVSDGKIERKSRITDIFAVKRGRGRPKGSKNKRKYPRGVKRPRKQKDDKHGVVT